MTCIILHNLQNTNLQILLENSVLRNFQVKPYWNQQNRNLQIMPAKTAPGNLSLIIDKKKKERRKKNLRHFCKHLLGNFR